MLDSVTRRDDATLSKEEGKASRRVARHVNGTNAIEHRQFIAIGKPDVDQRGSRIEHLEHGFRQAGQAGMDEGIAKFEAGHLIDVADMHGDGSAGECPHFLEGADVVQMAMRDDDKRDIFRRPADFAQRRRDDVAGAWSPDVEENDVAAIRGDVGTTAPGTHTVEARRHLLNEPAGQARKPGAGLFGRIHHLVA